MWYYHGIYADERKRGLTHMKHNKIREIVSLSKKVSHQTHGVVRFGA